MTNQKTEQSRGAWGRRTIATVIIGVACAAGIAALAFYTTDPHAHDASVAYATWALALFTFFLAVGIPVTIWDSSNRSLEQEQDQFYAQLDGTYLEIQKIVIEYPHLGEPAALLKNPEAKPEQLTQYNAFAFVVWNFIESIYDFTHKGDDSPQGRRKTEMLTETWQCIIDYEGARHAEWFLRSENRQKFKEPFRKYIDGKRLEWKAAHPASTPQGV